MRGFSPLLFRLYASDLSEAIYALSRERQMGSQAALREALGRNDIEVRFGDGKQFVTMDGKTVELSAEASAAEVAQALNLAAPPTAALIPPVQIMPAMTSTVPTAPAKSAPAPGSFAASLKAMVNEALAGVEQAKENGASKVRAKVAMINDAKAAVVRVTDNMAQNLEDQANSVMAELGQISNDLTGEAD